MCALQISLVKHRFHAKFVFGGSSKSILTRIWPYLKLRKFEEGNSFFFFLTYEPAKRLEHKFKGTKLKHNRFVLLRQTYVTS